MGYKETVFSKFLCKYISFEMKKFIKINTRVLKTCDKEEILKRLKNKDVTYCTIHL